MPEQFAHGPEAARIFGVTRADEVWRAIRRHGQAYPGPEAYPFPAFLPYVNDAYPYP